MARDPPIEKADRVSKRQSSFKLTRKKSPNVDREKVKAINGFKISYVSIFPSSNYHSKEPHTISIKVHRNAGEKTHLISRSIQQLSQFHNTLLSIIPITSLQDFPVASF